MDNDALERLERRVESKGEPTPTPRRPLEHEIGRTPHEWKGGGTAMRKKSLFGFMSKFSPLEVLFAASIIFAVGAASVSSLLIFSGSNTVSTRNVDVAVAGPTSLRAGEEVSLQVVVTNRNTVPMNLTDLLVEYPPGTRSPLDVSIDLPRSRESLGTIEPGASVNRTVKAVIFGTAGEQVSVNVTAEYRVPSSNAVFQSSSVYSAGISQSPASITVETLTEVVSGQATDMTVTVTSNASENLTGMLLTATYPPGFQFETSTPKPFSGSSVWDIGDIEPKGKRTVVVRGTFTGEDGDDRVIHFTTGTKKRSDPGAIAAPLASADATITVAKPFVSVQLALNSAVSESVSVERGATVRGEVRWANNLPVRVQNVEIQVKFAGSILNKNSVRSNLGFYRSADNTIVFSKDTDPRFADVEPGASGTSLFEFAAFPPGQGSFQSPEITLTATVKANRASEGGVVDVVTSSARAGVQVITDLALVSSLVRSAGPLPPKVDTETVYTVTWLTTNSANAVANATVSGILPSFVTWKGGASSPDVVYNENNRSVTWAIGDMNANTTRAVSFSVGVTPSLTQMGTVVPLVTDQRVTAFDRFIRSGIERPMPAITTQTGTTIQMGAVVP